MLSQTNRVALTMALTVSTAVLAARGHLTPGQVEIEASSSRAWHQMTAATDNDTCTMAVMNHARKIHQSISQSEARLSSLINASSRKPSIEWLEKPQLKNGSSQELSQTKDKIQAALRSLAEAKKEIAAFAGRTPKDLALSSMIAKNHCEEQLILGITGSPGVLGKTDKALAEAQSQVRSLFDNGYVDMKQTGLEGFSKTFLDPVFDAQAEINHLGSAITTAPTKVFLGMLGTKNPLEKLKPRALESLQKTLKRDYPLAFESYGAVKAGSDREKQMLAVNQSLFNYVQQNAIGYSDAAKIWKMGLIRLVNKESNPQASADFLDNFIIDQIQR